MHSVIDRRHLPTPRSEHTHTRSDGLELHTTCALRIGSTPKEQGAWQGERRHVRHQSEIVVACSRPTSPQNLHTGKARPRMH